MSGAKNLASKIGERARLLVLAYFALGVGSLQGVEPAKKRDLPTPSVGEVEPTAEGKDKTAYDGSGLVLVPLVMYSPETHFGLGGLMVRFFRVGGESKDSRVSSLAVIALVTTRLQAIFEILPEVYWDNENNHVFVRLEYQHYPDSFWGIGDRTPNSAEERYSRERVHFRGGPRRRIVGPLYAGVFTDLMYLKGDYSNNGIFATTDVPGEDGGFTLGVGPSVSYDTRDNTVQSRAGTLLSATWVWFGNALGSRYEFWKLITEARQFFPIGTDSALGIRYYGEFQSGDVPYYQLAMLGGDELLRGYYLGRYRDEHLVVLEAEYRFPIYWRFGGVAFAGAGEVASSPGELDGNPIRPAFGGGLRLALSPEERLNLRLDFGIGPQTYGIYFTAREAF